MIKGRAILLDTCVIQYSLSKEPKLREATGAFIAELIQSENRLFVSDYSYYELLKGANKENKAKAEEMLNHFEQIPQSKDRLERAPYCIQLTWEKTV